MIPFWIFLGTNSPHGRKYGISTVLLFLAYLLSVPVGYVYADRIVAEELPLMRSLQRGDPLFDQLAADLSSYYRARAQKGQLPALTLMRYTVKSGETLFSISARLNLPHSTIASINRLNHPSLIQTGKELIVPNLPGIYLPQKPSTQLEEILFGRLKERTVQAESVTFDQKGIGEYFWYFPSEDYSPQERLAFLGSIFRPPLASYRISSTFGPRRNPLSGVLIKHEGIDMVAPLGARVMAAADGEITTTGFDAVYGNYIIIAHKGGYQTMYGHLLRLEVKKGQSVRAGDTIGTLGNTGQSTGPHIHFEIHLNGTARDPLSFIRQ